MSPHLVLLCDLNLMPKCFMALKGKVLRLTVVASNWLNDWCQGKPLNVD